MGKKFWYGIVLLLVLPAVGCLSCSYLYQTMTPMHNDLEEISQNIRYDDISKAQYRLRSVQDAWQKNLPAVSSLFVHSLVEQTHQELSRLSSQLSTGEVTHAEETCRILTSLFFTLGNEQLPFWWNLL